jgi:hypothetical protein
MAGLPTWIQLLHHMQKLSDPWYSMPSNPKPWHANFKLGFSKKLLLRRYLSNNPWCFNFLGQFKTFPTVSAGRVHLVSEISHTSKYLLLSQQSLWSKFMLVRRNTVRMIQRGIPYRPKRMPTCWALQDKWVMPLCGSSPARRFWGRFLVTFTSVLLKQGAAGHAHRFQTPPGTNKHCSREEKPDNLCFPGLRCISTTSTRNSVQSGNCIIIWSSLSTQFAVILDDVVGGQGIKLEFQHTFTFVLFPLDQMGLAVLIFLCLAVCRLLSALMLIDLRQNLWTLVTSILCSWSHLLSKELTWSHDSPSVLLRSFCL